MSNKEKYTEAYWREHLSPEQYVVCREKGTEAAFTGEYWNELRAGDYVCRGCSVKLFAARDKFDAGCGWPSFSMPANAEAVQEEFDESHGMRRTEVLCRECGCHLGHVFNDGPQPQGLRYCINSASIVLQEKEQGD